MNLNLSKLLGKYWTFLDIIELLKKEALKKQGILRVIDFNFCVNNIKIFKKEEIVNAFKRIASGKEGFIPITPDHENASFILEEVAQEIGFVDFKTTLEDLVKLEAQTNQYIDFFNAKGIKKEHEEIWQKIIVEINAYCLDEEILWYDNDTNYPIYIIEGHKCFGTYQYTIEAQSNFKTRFLELLPHLLFSTYSEKAKKLNLKGVYTKLGLALPYFFIEAMNKENLGFLLNFHLHKGNIKVGLRIDTLETLDCNIELIKNICNNFNAYANHEEKVGNKGLWDLNTLYNIGFLKFDEFVTSIIYMSVTNQITMVPMGKFFLNN